ncbi:hypothetical protein GPALN_011112 [Globodera pallida]|nr:hypothetical protein GPALN_011112 [Globodera pallida]
MESTRVSDAEHKRREAQVREGARDYNVLDPFTWSFPSKCTATGTAILGSSMTYYSLWYRKPWYSALVLKVAGFAVAVGACYFVALSRGRAMAERDAVVEHYIRLHPEDFERINNFHGRLYRDILLPWVPIRGQYYKVEDK